jgi:hypothetical protein
MTEIMQMTPEELNRAIAKAKGWTVGWYHEKLWGSDENHVMRPMNWTDDIAAAWELVEEIFAAGKDFHFECVHDDPANPWWFLAYDDDNLNGEIASTEAPTAPIAISRAWLMWKAAQ